MWRTPQQSFLMRRNCELNAFEVEDKLQSVYGPTAGIPTIGQGEENLVKFANIVSQGTMMTIEWTKKIVFYLHTTSARDF